MNKAVVEAAATFNAHESGEAGKPLPSEAQRS